MLLVTAAVSGFVQSQLKRQQVLLSSSSSALCCGIWTQAQAGKLLLTHFNVAQLFG